ncbi:MAG: SoxR reducing system RseC family protein [Rikenellaceae bacterium]
MATKNFSHSGKILSVENGFAIVGFESQGACGGCQARSKCGMVDSSTREVQVKLNPGQEYSVGDVVNVAISYEMGVVSVVVAYIIPLIILVSALVLTLYIGVGEGVAALISLAVVVVYYFGVYCFRSKLDKQIKFTIEN